MVAPATPSLDLTLNKEVRQGMKQIILTRKLGDTAEAMNILYQTESEIGMSKDSDSEATKSGPITTPGAIEYDFSLTCYMAVNDPAIKMLEQAFLNNELVELWDINLQHPKEEGSSQYASNYYHAYVTSITPTSPADEMVELEFEFGVQGQHVDGWATVSETQEETAKIVFKDTTAQA